MKKIGLVDFYLSEWHADNYLKRIVKANKSMKESEHCEVAYAWAERGVSPTDGVTSAQWCEKNDVRLCGSVEELCEKSDYIVILSPLNPEKHLGYAEKVFPFGKNTFIDAPLASDYASAEKIFDLAKKYGTKFFSASALRFADGVKTMNENMIVITGGGETFDNFIVHQVEAATAIVGVGADFVRVDDGRDFEVDKCGYGVKIHYPDSRMVTLLYAPRLGFEIITDVKRIEIRDEILDKLSIEILKFLTSGEMPFDPRESLEVVRINEKLLEGKSTSNKWVSLWGNAESLL